MLDPRRQPLLGPLYRPEGRVAVHGCRCTCVPLRRGGLVRSGSVPKIGTQLRRHRDCVERSQLAHSVRRGGEGLVGVWVHVRHHVLGQSLDVAAARGRGRPHVVKDSGARGISRAEHAPAMRVIVQHGVGRGAVASAALGIVHGADEGAGRARLVQLPQAPHALGVVPLLLLRNTRTVRLRRPRRLLSLVHREMGCRAIPPFVPSSW